MIDSIIEARDRILTLLEGSLNIRMEIGGRELHTVSKSYKIHLIQSIYYRFCDFNFGATKKSFSHLMNKDKITVKAPPAMTRI